MSIFDDLLGNWIQKIDEQNEITIENYGYETQVLWFFLMGKNVTL